MNVSKQTTVVYLPRIPIFELNSHWTPVSGLPFYRVSVESGSCVRACRNRWKVL